MEPLKTVIFVDGRNFKSNLQAFHFYSSDPTSRWRTKYYALDEKHFNWYSFFQGVLKKFNESTGYEYRLIRVYWYNAASIRPYEPNDYLIQNALNECRRRFPEITHEQLTNLAEAWYKQEKGYFEIAKEKVYRFIQSSYSFIEFKYIGEYVVKPFDVYKIERNPDGTYFYQGRKEGEKGVDVGIAVDAIAKANNYDVAILLSGDADFIPVVCHLKDNLKYVYQFSIAQGIPPRIQYLSAFLKDVADVFGYYNEVELLGTHINRSTIPRDILSSIDARVAQLGIQP
jgi:uncharacterized LabA/DUF88 family protein